MIANKKALYSYSEYEPLNEYGTQDLSAKPKGFTKMAIFLTSQSIQDNINYKDCNYIGLTNDSFLNDNCVIDYGKEKLKVMYINEEGRLNQVFMMKI